MQPHPTYFIFDFDGTLAQSGHVHWLAWHQTCKDFGIPNIREADYQQFIGAPSGTIIKTHLERHGLDTSPEFVQKLIAHKRKIYEANLQKVERHEPMVSLLRVLAAVPHYKIALATSAPRDHAETMLKQFGIDKFFDVAVYADDVKNHKPAPDCYELAAKLLGAKPEECLVFEDSESGVAAAKAFGAHVVKVVQ